MHCLSSPLWDTWLSWSPPVDEKARGAPIQNSIQRWMWWRLSKVDRFWEKLLKRWKLLGHVQLFVTPWTSPGQNSGVGSLLLLQRSPWPRNQFGSPALQADSLPTELSEKTKNTGVGSLPLLRGIFPTQGPRERGEYWGWYWGVPPINWGQSLIWETWKLTDWSQTDHKRGFGHSDLEMPLRALRGGWQLLSSSAEIPANDRAILR